MVQTVIIHGESQRRQARELLEKAPVGSVMRIGPASRTLEQNALLWPLLTDLSRQVAWPVNGVMQKLSKEDWKDLATAALAQENRVAQGLNGGCVFLGRRTSTMSKKTFSDLLEVIFSFGSSQGVVWSAPNAEDER